MPLSVSIILLRRELEPVFAFYQALLELEAAVEPRAPQQGLLPPTDTD